MYTIGQIAFWALLILIPLYFIQKSRAKRKAAKENTANEE